MPNSEEQSDSSDVSTDGSTVYCNVITNRGGAELDLRSKLRSEAFIGCDEANIVMNEYLSLPVERYQGSGQFAMVRGYNCGTDGKTQTACTSEDGLSVVATLKG